ncbi:uncharacterized protein SCHCODRAFT_02161486 [Schizophyllum commune H4-8]|uniref:uncharacterized protein n=1 Tax=Schizophyllum commune (strain H4-8 / FGSC 9210) TaxID=578458 RepID=UPI00216061F3|nr:uncharacterized protein SCHCODRAFT_02161486 [Schizophyllum commune H4-8]KAI5898296.1 hypothetical protein SCHCODRAFT_02161486 [Schizophyllum commune H4-8]
MGGSCARWAHAFPRWQRLSGRPACVSRGACSLPRGACICALAFGVCPSQTRSCRRYTCLTSAPTEPEGGLSATARPPATPRRLSCRPGDPSVGPYIDPGREREACKPAQRRLAV